VAALDVAMEGLRQQLKRCAGDTLNNVKLTMRNMRSYCMNSYAPPRLPKVQAPAPPLAPPPACMAAASAIPAPETPPPPSHWPRLMQDAGSFGPKEPPQCCGAPALPQTAPPEPPLPPPPPELPSVAQRCKNVQDPEWHHGQQAQMNKNNQDLEQHGGEFAIPQSPQQEFQEPGTGESITSLMLCNLPCRLTQQQLAGIIESLGFGGKYDFMYLPASRGSANLGYGFVNFKTPEDATRFSAAFTNYRVLHSRSTKVFSVKPARLQGRAALMEQFYTKKSGQRTTPAGAPSS